MIKHIRGPDGFHAQLMYHLRGEFQFVRRKHANMIANWEKLVSRSLHGPDRKECIDFSWVLVVQEKYQFDSIPSKIFDIIDYRLSISHLRRAARGSRDGQLERDGGAGSGSGDDHESEVYGSQGGYGREEGVR